ncbi:sulfatase [Paenibacillus sp. NPDC056579]|uniref:sulfatase family protein n=1 Tax=Paenibacillus sp. NPDC056579 TaxID=3345871 RepID=UPI003681B9EC
MSNRPNILLITSDQQHWNTIGAFNNEISTPNLDRLVREGTTFNRAYCPNPTCTPTRSSIITGQYPSQHGAWTLGTKLSEKARTVGEEFLDAGYETALIGKAHFQPLVSTPEYPSLEAYPVLQDLDFWKKFDQTYYGFRHVELARNHTNEAHIGQHYAIWLEEKGCTHWRDYFQAPTGTMDKSVRHKWTIPEEYHYDAWIAERTNVQLERYKQEDNPFLLWASFFDPHPPYLVPEPWDTMYDPEKLTIPRVLAGEHDVNPPHFQLAQQEKPDFSAYKESGFANHGLHSHKHSEAGLRRNIATYYGMTSLMDKYIGRILDKLDELDLADNTLVVFTSDHGHFYGHHGLIAKGPFHYEDLIRVPMLVRYPGHVPAGHVNASMQSLVDFAPTLLRYAGLAIPYTMSGKDQSEVWNGRQDALRTHILCENHHEPTTIHLKTYVDERYKLTVYFNQEYGEMFDLHQDPEERYNLWDKREYADLKSKLLLKYVWAELGKEPLFMPRVANA